MARRLRRDRPSGNNNSRSANNGHVSMNTEDERSAVYWQHRRNIDRAINNSQLIDNLHFATDTFGWDSHRWESYCSDFVKSYEKDKTLKDADLHLSFYDVQRLITHDFMDRSMRLACFAPLMMRGCRQGGFGESLGRFLSYTAVSKLFAAHDGVSDLKRKQKLAKQGGEKSSFDSFNGRRRYSQFQRPLDAERAAMQSIAFSTTTYHAMRKKGADIEGLQEAWEKAHEALYEAAVADGVSREDIDRSVRIIAGQMFEADPETMSWFTEVSTGEAQQSEYHRVTNPDGSTTLHWDGEFFNPETGEDFTGTFHPRPPQGLSTHFDVMKAYLQANMREWDDPSQFVEEFKNLRIDDTFIKRTQNIGWSMSEDGYLSEDINVVAKYAALESLCEYDAAQQTMAVLSNEQPSSRVCDMFVDNPQMMRYYKAFFNDYIENSRGVIKERFGVDVDSCKYRERPLHVGEVRGFVTYPENYVPNFVADYATLVDFAKDHDCFDSSQAKPDIKIDYEASRPIREVNEPAYQSTDVEDSRTDSPHGQYITVDFDDAREVDDFDDDYQM